MAAENHVRIYLEEGLLQSARNGEHNFLNKVAVVLRTGGLDVNFLPIEQDDTHRSGYALTHMKPPPSGGLVFRRVYAYPFWAIEASEKRWEWDVAQVHFDENAVNKREAKRFADRWRNRLFDGVETTDEGFIYIPLQGRILERRSFQYCAPVEMIDRVKSCYPDRTLVVGLHPKETYTKADHSHLAQLAARDALIRIETGGMDTLLPKCSAVVTANSSVAFFGFLLGKPAALFAKIDFHHIALDGMNQLSQLLEHKPAFDAFMYWFWQSNSVNAGRDDAEERIRKRFARFGWFA